MDRNINITRSYSAGKEARERRRIASILNATTSLFNARLSYFSVFAIALLFASFYLQTFFYLVLALLICLPFFSYHITRYAFNTLKTDIRVTDAVYEKGSTSELAVTVTDPVYIPISDFEVTVNIESLFYGSDGPKTYSMTLKPHKDNTIAFPVTHDKYGIYRISLTGIAAYDHLHLFRFERTVTSACEITIMPDIPKREEPLEALETEGFDEFTDNDRRGSYSSNVTDIREYRDGDRLSRIHWKLTEKLDKLIVKENEATSSNEITVLLELYQPSYKECEEAYFKSGGEDTSLCNVLDNAIEEAWAVSMQLIDAGQTFTFLYYDAAGDFASYQVSSADGLSDIMTRAFYSPVYDTKDLALSVYTAAGLNRGTLIHVG